MNSKKCKHENEVVCIDCNADMTIKEMLDDARAEERAKMTNAKILEYLRTPEGKQQYFDNFGERIEDIERKAYLDGQNQMAEKADDAFRKVFDKVQEHRKVHKGNCNCPACNPTIAMLYAEFIGELQASERPKEEGRK